MKLLRTGCIFLWGLSWLAANAEAKPVSIQWDTLPKAIRYELRVEREGTRAAAYSVREPAWAGELTPGMYNYRVRAVDRFERPGPWSEPQPLAVLPPAPAPLTPAPDHRFGTFTRGTNVTIGWNPVEGASGYLIEYVVPGNPVGMREATKPELELHDVPPGAYQWRVSAIVAPGERAPASIRQRKLRWQGPASAPSAFIVEKRELAKPVPVWPYGELVPPADGKLTLNWKPVEGAAGYEVRMSNGSQVLTARSPPLVVAAPPEGDYAWKVRALASDNPATARGPESSAEFKLDRNASLSSGEGFFALSTMIAPYNFSATSPASRLAVSTQASSFAVRASGETWLSRQWAVGAGVDTTMMVINDVSYSRYNVEAVGKFRASLTSSARGWFIAPKAGLEFRQYLDIDSDRSTAANPALAPVGALGAVLGVDVRKDLSHRWSLGVKAQYWVPFALIGAPSGSHLTGDSSYRNVGAGVQALYWFSPAWGAGAGTLVELRSLSFAAAARPDLVAMDAAYFFGSLIFKLGL